jgi:hypothetical protein
VCVFCVCVLVRPYVCVCCVRVRPCVCVSVCVCASMHVCVSIYLILCQSVIGICFANNAKLHNSLCKEVSDGVRGPDEDGISPVFGLVCACVCKRGRERTREKLRRLRQIHQYKLCPRQQCVVSACVRVFTFYLPIHTSECVSVRIDYPVALEAVFRCVQQRAPDRGEPLTPALGPRVTSVS